MRIGFKKNAVVSTNTMNVDDILDAYENLVEKVRSAEEELENEAMALRGKLASNQMKQNRVSGLLNALLKYDDQQ